MICTRCNREYYPGAGGNAHACPIPYEGKPPEAVDHPQHYGGADNPYEAIKVIEAWQLGFCLGNTVKYIARAELKGTPVQDLEKAAWYLKREIENRKKAAV